MNSSIACRYPRFDSGERRLSSTADLLWSRSGRPSFVFGRFGFESFRLACLLIPAASAAAGKSLSVHVNASGVSRQVDSEQPNFGDWPLSSKVQGNEQIQ